MQFLPCQPGYKSELPMDKTVTADPRPQSSGIVKPADEALQKVGEENWQSGRSPSFY